MQGGRERITSPVPYVYHGEVQWDAMFTRKGDGMTLATVIQQLVDHHRDGSRPAGLLGSLLGESSRPFIDEIQEVLNDYQVTLPVQVPKSTS